MIKLRCWADDRVNTENYIIPEDSITHSETFIEKVRFYRRDVEFHKKQVNDEIITFWKVDGLNKDVKKLIVDKYIKRPIKYGCHIKPEEKRRNWEKWFTIVCLLIILCILQYQTTQVAKVVGNELRKSHKVHVTAIEYEDFVKMPNCKYVCNDKNPPACDCV